MAALRVNRQGAFSKSMKKWHAKTIGECDVHRDIYEEGNPNPIAPPIVFDAANALVAAHNGEQVELGDATPTPQGQSRSETGATERDEQIAREAANAIVAHYREGIQHVVGRGNVDAADNFIGKAILSAITRANKARSEQSAPAAEQWWYEQIEGTSVFRVHFDAQNFVEVTGRICAAMIVDAGNKHAAPSPAQENLINETGIARFQAAQEKEGV